jgi:very-short-patch-repair endonuclease
MPWPERRLWFHLRGGRLNGIKFKRQVPIGRYIVDFCAPQHRLIVEVDGNTHAGRAEADRRRQTELESHGFAVVRVTNDEVMQNLEAVLQYIASCAAEGDRDGQSPSP